MIFGVSLVAPSSFFLDERYKGKEKPMSERRQKKKLARSRDALFLFSLSLARERERRKKQKREKKKKKQCSSSSRPLRALRSSSFSRMGGLTSLRCVLQPCSHCSNNRNDSMKRRKKEQEKKAMQATAKEKTKRDVFFPVPRVRCISMVLTPVPLLQRHYEIIIRRSRR